MKLKKNIKYTVVACVSDLKRRNMGKATIRKKTKVTTLYITKKVSHVPQILVQTFCCQRVFIRINLKQQVVRKQN